MYNHRLFLKAIEYYLHQMRLRRYKRAKTYFSIAFLASFMGVCLSLSTGMIATLPAFENTFTNWLFDKSYKMILNNDLKQKYNRTIENLLYEHKTSRGVDLDPLDYNLCGQHFSQSANEELAYHAYMMAHYLDHENIEGNSGLPFSTYKEDAKKR